LPIEWLEIHQVAIMPSSMSLIRKKYKCFIMIIRPNETANMICCLSSAWNFSFVWKSLVWRLERQKPNFHGSYKLGKNENTHTHNVTVYSEIRIIGPVMI
jgi:hypothetical protein